MDLPAKHKQGRTLQSKTKYFEKSEAWLAFFVEMIESHTGYYSVIEYTKRGAVHCHLLVTAKDK